MRPRFAWLALLGLTVVAVPSVVVYATGFAAVFTSPLALLCLVSGSCAPAAIGASVARRDHRNRLAESRGDAMDGDHGRRLSRRLAQRERELQITYGIYRELESRLAMMEAKIDSIERGEIEESRSSDGVQREASLSSPPFDPVIARNRSDRRTSRGLCSQFPVHRAADLYTRNGEDEQA
ncbi:MAG: hypothetical protein CME06_05810 [Gemmatimonadetes bacterium]|nr:hypothetical protein [Gemmatimonadota bacterium]